MAAAARATQGMTSTELSQLHEAALQASNGHSAEQPARAGPAVVAGVVLNFCLTCLSTRPSGDWTGSRHSAQFRSLTATATTAVPTVVVVVLVDVGAVAIVERQRNSCSSSSSRAVVVLPTAKVVAFLTCDQQTLRESVSGGSLRLGCLHGDLHEKSVLVCYTQERERIIRKSCLFVNRKRTRAAM